LQTPNGEFHIINKAINPGGPFGALWMGLSKPHYGIHGTNDPSSIGKMVSHGCIRMYNQDVIELSKLVNIGTHVTIRS
jgi:lipoprotein-anchoring transpeptidase ErfK/SrfK